MAPSSIDFRRVRRRIQRTLNYGCRSTKSLSLPLSEYVVDYFDKVSPFDYMRPETSTSISRGGYADPCTLVIALVYLDRLRTHDQKFFESSNPRDIYLPSLILASKFLYDSDQNERTANSDWAHSVDMEPERLNQLEWDVVTRMDWDCLVRDDDFEKILANLERYVAGDFLKKYGFGSYNEMQLLSDAIESSSYWSALFHLMSMLGAATITYTLTLFSLFAAPMILQSASSSVSTPSVSFPEKINHSAILETPLDHLQDYTNYEESSMDLLSLAEENDFDRLPDPSQDNDFAEGTFGELLLRPLTTIRKELEGWLPLRNRPDPPFDSELCLSNPFNISSSFNFGLLMKVS